MIVTYAATCWNSLNQEDLYNEWEYEQYLKTTDNPLSFDEWLKTLERPEKGNENGI